MAWCSFVHGWIDSVIIVGFNEHPVGRVEGDVGLAVAGFEEGDADIGAGIDVKPHALRLEGVAVVWQRPSEDAGVWCAVRVVEVVHVVFWLRFG